MKKLTKEQKKALERLLSDLDELSNKPHRLFRALRELAEAFDDKAAIPSLREAEETFYMRYDTGHFLNHIFDALRQFKIDVWKKQLERDGAKEDDSRAVIYGGEKLAQSLAGQVIKDDLWL